MDSVFQNAGATPEVPVQPDSQEKAKRAEKVTQMKEAFKATVESDPSFVSRLRRLSKSIKMVNTLGYGEGGNIVVDKNAPADDEGKRKLKATSYTVGYKISNIGEETISYTTEEWVKDPESGEYKGNTVTKNLAPGESANLTRKYMTMLCAQPEISFTLANGIMVASSRKTFKNLDEELSSYYFRFNREEDGSVVQVNDDEVKISIDVDGVVTPEYEATFGYLNNPKKKRSTRERKGSRATVQDLAANYINKLIQEQQM